LQLRKIKGKSELRGIVPFVDASKKRIYAMKKGLKKEWLREKTGLGRNQVLRRTGVDVNFFDY